LDNVQTGGSAIFISCDVSDAKSVENMVNEAVKAYGRIDCAVNNAGILGVHAKVVLRK
jgi:NAD(P)-dependent dehydrogenase (short-subunit alcohol dehydrogenase family)